MGERYRPELDGVRAFAAFAVLASHCQVAFTPGGGHGVDVFFVLSGYIVSESARSHPQHFLRNRLLRVFPPYALAAAMATIAASHHGLQTREMLATATLWPAYDRIAWPYLPVAWSLCYEMLFYLGLWLVTRGVRPLFLVIAFAACFALANFTTWAPIRFMGSPIILEFLAGVLLAQGAIRSRLPGAILAVATLIGGALLFDPGWLGHLPVADPAGWLRVFLWGFPAVLLVQSAMDAEAFFRRRWARPLVFLGDASYSLYLYHVLAGTMAATLLGPVSPWLKAAICIAAGVGVYLGFERPMLRILRGPHRPVAPLVREPAA